MTLKTYEYTKIIGKENIEFGKNVIIDDFVLIYAKNKIKIGNYVHIASFSSLVSTNYLEMQDFCGVSHGVRIFTSSEDFKEWGFGNPTIEEKYRNIKHGNVIIEKFSIIGANSVILPNVTIGEGVTVGACSVVTKDLAPWGIYIGNKRMGERDQKKVMDNYEKFLSDK